MTTFIKIDYFLLLAMKKIGESLNENLNDAARLKIKYQDLGWIRKERNEKLRRAEYGNTNTFEEISHTIKRAMTTRLYTIYKNDLPTEIYNQYLEIMKNNYLRFKKLKQRSPYMGCIFLSTNHH